MWTSNRKTEGRTVEAAADLGLVTLGGDPAGVYLGGERRWVAVCAPGGYQWRPQTGDKVLVVKAGDQREIPCLAGVRQPEIQEKEDPLEAGAVRITGGSGQMDLNTKGVVLNGKETALKGRVTVNGERLEGAEALLQRVLFRLTARRGQFPFLPELGSRLYQLGREKPSAREALALQYVTEALAQESELAVTGVELTETTPGRAALRTDLNWRGAPLSVAVEVRI